jgi:hypothetical protein
MTKEIIPTTTSTLSINGVAAQVTVEWEYGLKRLMRDQSVAPAEACLSIASPALPLSHPLALPLASRCLAASSRTSYVMKPFIGNQSHQWHRLAYGFVHSRSRGEEGVPEPGPLLCLGRTHRRPWHSAFAICEVTSASQCFHPRTVRFTLLYLQQ